ncbi:MAG: discoidin domain-containing protein, partial [Planctomycetes bacterium]|nr:discoidin domain-containing protein [Planctomycetota bacterium]
MCKKLIYLVSFVLVLGLTLTSTAGADLIGYWPLDEGAGTTVADVSGAGHNGFFVDGTPEWVEGKFGKALKFNGSNKVEIPDHPDFHLQDAISMALWIKPTEAVQPGYAKPFTKQKGTTEYPYAIQYNGSGESIRATVNASARFDTSHTPNFAGQWGHLCMTYDGSAVILYKDAEEVGRIAATGKLQQNDLSLSIGGRLGSGQNFIGIIDDVRLYSHALTKEEIQQVMKGPPAGPASKPNPAGEETDVPRDVVLSWTPGEFAPPTNGHKVYFSDNFSDVNDGIGGITQDANSYARPQRLDFGTTYYWRIDEVNNVNPDSPWIGNVWSFTTEPVAYAIENITATASSTSQPGMGPENTINGSGLDANDLHSAEATDMWLSDSESNGAWIEYEFDKVHKLHQMWVWNSNQVMESFVGFGFKDVTIEYATNGTDYTTLGTTHEFARAPGTPDYAYNTTVDFGGVTAKYVRLTTNSNWGGIMDQHGLSEVRFLHIPVFAREPSPDSGTTDVAVDVTLGFRAGREAAEHNVYLSSDEQAVIDGNAPVSTVTETSFGPLSLDLGTTYYWKISEVNEAETPTTWQGDTWNFTTHEFFVVDGFEDYNDYPPDEIWATWVDGYGVPANGATAGYPAPDFLAGEHYVETTI